VVNDTTHLEG